MSECVEFALRRCGLRHSLTLKPEQLKSVEVVLAGSHVNAVLPLLHPTPKNVLFQSPGFFFAFFSFGETNLSTIKST